MDTKFQTSFIPKKSTLVSDKVVHHHSGTSVFMFLGILIFLISLGGSVFSVLWKGKLEKDQERYKQELRESEKRFNTSLIEELKKANTKIDLSKKLLKNHIASSQVFGLVSSLTIEGVRFTSYEFSGPTKDGESISVVMKGVGSNFSSIAFQSKVFGEPTKYDISKILKDPVLSDLALNENGTVNFTFTAKINPDDITYEKALTQENI